MSGYAPPAVAGAKNKPIPSGSRGRGRGLGRVRVVPRLPLRNPPLEVNQSAASIDICEVCHIYEVDSSQDELWHGCDCGKWFHAKCTKYTGETPNDFSCRKVKAIFGETCSQRKPKDIGRRMAMLPPSRKLAKTSSVIAEDFSTNTSHLASGKKVVPSNVSIPNKSHLHSASTPIQSVAEINKSQSVVKAAEEVPDATGCEMTAKTPPGFKFAVKFKNPKPANEDIDSPPTKEILDKIADAATPLSKFPYHIQLANKQKEIIKMVQFMQSEVLAASPDNRLWVDMQVRKFGYLAKLHKVEQCSSTDGYRNKCQFDIGINPETKKLIVGFKLDPKSSNCLVGPIDHLRHIPPNMKFVVKLLEMHLGGTGYKPYDSELGRGAWLSAIVKVTQKSETMLIVNFNPRDMSKPELIHLKERLKHFFESGEGARCSLTSFYVCEITANPPGVLSLLSGTDTITETLLGLELDISPTAFFCDNSRGAEFMVERITNLTDLHSGQTLLYICCGTGSIGLCLSSRVGQVIGVDISEDAIVDARLNAAKNEINNAEFIVGPAEDKIIDMINKATHEDIVDIIDPPMSGISSKALHTIRNSPQITKVMLLSRDPKAIMTNLVDLAQRNSATFKGDPFMPIFISPLDIYPHTTQTMTLFLFGRADLDQGVSPDLDQGVSPDLDQGVSPDLDQGDSPVEPPKQISQDSSKMFDFSLEFESPNKSKISPRNASTPLKSQLPGCSRQNQTLSDSINQSEFGTPRGSKDGDNLERDILDEVFVEMRNLSPREIRTQTNRMLPSRTLASVLKEKDPKAYAQFVLEMEVPIQLPRSGCARKRQGPVFPTGEEIDDGALPYNVPKWKAFGGRSKTAANKVMELVINIECAEAVLDIIPTFESKSKEVKRITYISPNYFNMAEKDAEGQLKDSQQPPQVARASSLELPESIHRPAGPPPEVDTGRLDQQLDEVSCEICHRKYGSAEDNEYQDWLLGCQADRLCSSSKMYHLGCYIPMARVIIDYQNIDEVAELRKVVFCSRQCKRLASERDARDEEGLQMGRGGKRRRKENNDAEP